jgi:hypothetical protein
MANASKYELHQICRSRKWKYYSKFNKKNLLRYINLRTEIEHRSVIKLQKWWRTFLNPVNSIDIFSLEAIDTTCPKFLIMDKISNTSHQFPLKTLCEYFFESGKFINPLTRYELSPYTLKRLQRTYFRNYPKDRSLLYNSKRTEFTEKSDVVNVARLIDNDKREENQRDQSMDLLEYDGTRYFELCIDNLERPNVVHELLIPDLTNILVSMYSIHTERYIKFTDSLYQQVLQQLHLNHTYKAYKVLLDLEHWLKRHKLRRR